MMKMSFEWAIGFGSFSLSPHAFLCSYWEAKKLGFHITDHHGQSNETLVNCLSKIYLALLFSPLFLRGIMS